MLKNIMQQNDGLYFITFSFYFYPLCLTAAAEAATTTTLAALNFMNI
jgi:hypothetical protein